MSQITSWHRGTPAAASTYKLKWKLAYAELPTHRVAFDIRASLHPCAGQPPFIKRVMESSKSMSHISSIRSSDIYISESMYHVHSIPPTTIKLVSVSLRVCMYVDFFFAGQSWKCNWHFKLNFATFSLFTFLFPLISSFRCLFLGRT